MFETEFPFVLPKGYIDFNGTLHKEGVMRPANAAGESAAAFSELAI